MFSVVIPAFNCARTVIPAIESVLAQTRLDLIEEILVINDGSTDDTNAVLERYVKEQHPVPIRLFSRTNHGVSATRNFGIRKARAPWIALLDADDKWLPKKLERQYEAIRSEPKIKLLGTMYPLKILFGQKNGLIHISPQELCIRSVYWTTSVVFEKDTGLAFGLFDETMQFSEDLQFFQKFLTVDGCYVLGEDLVRIDCWKAYSGASGLSSHLHQMHEGRNRCATELCAAGLISPAFLRSILIFNEFKYLRRVSLCAMKRFVYEILRGWLRAARVRSVFRERSLLPVRYVVSASLP